MQTLFASAAQDGITHVLSGEVLRTPKGLTVTSRLTDLRRNVELGANRQEALQPEDALSFSTATAASAYAVVAICAWRRREFASVMAVSGQGRIGFGRLSLPWQARYQTGELRSGSTRAIASRTAGRCFVS